MKATLDTVLPEVHKRFSNLHNEITRVRVALEDWKNLGDFRGVSGKSMTVCRYVSTTVCRYVQVSNLFSSFLLVQRPK
jgi:hypothetical protein